MSKLDEAFLKAYAKVRGTGRETVTDAPPASDHAVGPPNAQQTSGAAPVSHGAQVEDGLSRADATDELLQILRLEDGVVNVASFIARTGNGRTRGTAQRPQGGVADDVPTVNPRVPESHSQPNHGFETIRIVDSTHALQGPHFQPISLDLAALDVFAPAMAVATAAPPRAAHVEASAQDTFVTQAPTQFDTIVRPRTDKPAPARSSSTTESTSQAATGGPTDRGQSFPSSGDNRLFLRTDEAHEVEPATEATDPIDQSAELQQEEGYDEVVQEVIQEDELLQKQFEAAPVLSIQHSRQEQMQQHQAAQSEPAEFLAAWEVDRFEFEDIIWDLSAENSPLWAAVEQLEIACREGLQVLAITSPSRGQGRSTLSITLARMLAATGLNVALLDGDIDRPALADKLCLEIRLGWGDAVRTGLSVEEVAVQSVEDGFTVLPSAPPDSAKALRPAAEATGAMLDTLRNAFDLIIVDTANVNVIGGWIPGAENERIDAALVIQDLRQDDPEAMQACLRRLQKLGINNIGLVENFASV